MSNKKIEYGKVYDVGSDDEEIVNFQPTDVVGKNVIELSEIPQPEPQNTRNTQNYKLLSESLKRSTSPDELVFLSDTNKKLNSDLMLKVRDTERKRLYEIWDTLIEKGRQIDEDVVRMMQNYIIRECHSDNLDNLERCRKYREILEQYWDKNPSLREKQQRIGGKLLRRAKKYTTKSKRKSSKKKRRTNRATRRYKKHKR